MYCSDYRSVYLSVYRTMYCSDYRSVYRSEPSCCTAAELHHLTNCVMSSLTLTPKCPPPLHRYLPLGVKARFGDTAENT